MEEKKTKGKYVMKISKEQRSLICSMAGKKIKGRNGNNGNSGFYKGHGRFSLGSTGKHWKKTPEQLENSRLANLGEKNPGWKGGITPEKTKIRMSKQYEQWRKSVFERDKYICQMCKEVGGQLNADHIKSFSQYPDLRLDLDNGRTLCIPCHKTTENYAGKSNRKIISINPNLFQNNIT